MCIARSARAATARRGAACKNSAVIRLTGACEHGHVAEREVCEEHRTPGEPLWCRACYRLPGTGAHECPVTFAGAGERGQATP